MENNAMHNNQCIKVIFGCGGHALNIADIILCNEPYARILFVDENAQENEYKLGFHVVKNPPPAGYRCIVGIGDNAKRKQKFDGIDHEQLFSAISPNAYLSHAAAIGAGCFISHLSAVCAGVIVGDNSIIGTSCVIGHDCQIGGHCFMGPNVTLAGYTHLGELVFIGAGATVIDKVRICSNVTVGAGATVVNDITVPGTYVGTPARRIK